MEYLSEGAKELLDQIASEIFFTYEVFKDARLHKDILIWSLRKSQSDAEKSEYVSAEIKQMLNEFAECPAPVVGYIHRMRDMSTNVDDVLYSAACQFILGEFVREFNKMLKNQPQEGYNSEDVLEKLRGHSERPQVLDTFLSYAILLDRYKTFLEYQTGDVSSKSKFLEKEPQSQPKSFEDLFYNRNDAEVCLDVLRELEPPVIDQTNNYIGKGKGIFQLWIMALKTHKPTPLIKTFKDMVYRDVLNSKIMNLNLSKDASEFRKDYKRSRDKASDIRTILSQYSQIGRLGK